MAGPKKMPIAPKTKGKLHPHHVEDKKAARTKPAAGKPHPMPHGIKTPDRMMPNHNEAHAPKRVAKGSHTNAGGTGHALNPPHMLMARKAKKNAKKRMG